MNKGELIEALGKSRNIIMAGLEGLDDEMLSRTGVVEQWTIKDLLFHMTMWEAELVKLLWQAAQGERPSTVHLAELPLDEINANWWAEGKDRALEQIWVDFHGVRKQTLRRLDAFTDRDLGDAKRFDWQKGIPLWKWIGEDTFLHEEEHAEQIKKWRAAQGI